MTHSVRVVEKLISINRCFRSRSAILRVDTSRKPILQGQYRCSIPRTCREESVAVIAANQEYVSLVLAKALDSMSPLSDIGIRRHFHGILGAPP
jgi:hypothetical protein